MPHSVYPKKAPHPPLRNQHNNQTSFTYSVQDTKGTTFLFEFAHCSYLQLSVNNNNCQGPDDQITFSLKPDYHEAYVVYPITEYGCFTNTYMEEAVPKGKYLVQWTVVKNGNSQSFDSTFNISKDQHKTFTINY